MIFNVFVLKLFYSKRREKKKNTCGKGYSYSDDISTVKHYRNSATFLFSELPSLVEPAHGKIY